MNKNSSSSIFRKESLERLSSPEQLDQLIQIVSPRSWLPLASLGMLIGLGFLWSVVGKIPITVSGRGVFVRSADSSNELVGLTYFNLDEVGQIQPGMEIMLLPDRADRTGSVGVIGQVKTVSEPEVTTLATARQTKPLDQDNFIEVVAELDPNSSGANHSGIAPGMRATARITLMEKAPIAFVFPFLEGSQ
ncbi:hypothetical protein [Egbenema bharatensis]|uniref:hypothetical protein n=1 Tax=Egbenema bharatensis TaxID=3463334 RepID=UPI003A866A89